jgi:hypothetical protein
MFKAISICKPGEKISKIGDVIQSLNYFKFLGSMLKVKVTQYAKSFVAMG